MVNMQNTMIYLIYAYINMGRFVEMPYNLFQIYKGNHTKYF